jgi:hypothetical protein
MSRFRVSLVILCWCCVAPLSAQEVQAGLGYAHIFGGGGFSFGLGYLQGLNPAGASVQQRVGASFWYANTDLASDAAGNAGRNLVGLGARYEVEMGRCCGPVHPLLAIPVQLIHSSVGERVFPTEPLALSAIPEPGPTLSAEELTSAWGWGAGVELGAEMPLGAQWNLRTSGTAMYQDIYTESTTNAAWVLHLGATYRFGGRRGT